jgi:hypothetical protein
VLQQIHDYSPGIAPNGLFWTIAVPPESVTIDLDNATASLQVADVPVIDAHDLANALTGGMGLTNPPIPAIAPVPATVSFAVQWGGSVNQAKVTNQASGFTGEFIETIATIKWSASEAGFDFVSEDPNPARNFYSVIGHERNGVFFHPGK